MKRNKKKSKTKQLSIPQLVILLDVLFIFLFILIIKETPPKTEIVLPPNKLERGGFLSYQYENGKYLWYDPAFQMWTGSETDNLSELYSSVGKYTLHLDCDENCINILKQKYDLHGYESNISIVITNELYDEIARVTYIACQANTEYCGDITFPINNKWEIDSKDIFKLNPFLKKIPGMENNFEEIE